MHDVFIIKELLEHILSFVPRKIITPCSLVCKNFLDAIKIYYNQDTVAKNSDMFSLLKIPYSPIAVINIAAKYKNSEIIEYLINKNMNLLGNYDICKIIGYIGSEHLLEKITEEYSLLLAISGLCEGLQFKLFDKYKHKLSYRDIFEIVKAAYKTNCNEMINNVLFHINPLENHRDIREGKMVGICARKNENDVYLHIKNFMLTIEMDLYNISIICDALIEGEHYDTFIWFLNENAIKNNEKYICKSDEIIEQLIINNNFKMFCYVISNNCFIWWSEDKNCNIVVEYNFGYGYLQGDLNFCQLVECCIEYRRIDMLKFLINHIRYNLIRYQEFLEKSQSLKFDDVTNVLILNKHLFIDYRE